MKDQEEAYHQAVEAALDAARAADTEALSEEAAERVAQDHLRRSPAERFLFAQNSVRLRRPEVVRWLLGESYALRHRNPAEMLRIAEAATELAENLPMRRGQHLLLASLRAEAWAVVANARRVAGDFHAAEAAWERVDGYLENGSSDTLTAVRLADLRASLRRDQGRVEEALALLTGVAEACRRLHDDAGSAQAFLKLALVHRMLGSDHRALYCLCQGGALLSDAWEPEVLAGVAKDLALLTHALGHAAEALLVLHRGSRMFARHNHTLVTGRLDWLKARLLRSLGHPAEAAALFEVARRRFVEENLPFTASQVSMELAAAYTDLQRFDLVEQLAEEMYPVFLSRDLPVEATAALTLFVKAAKRRRATAGRIAAVLRTLNNLEKKGQTRAARRSSPFLP